MTSLLELNSKGHRLVTSRNSGSRVKPVNSLTTSNNVEATTWKRQRGSVNLEATTWKGGGRNKNESTKIQNCDSTPPKPSNPLSEFSQHSPPPLFLTRQHGSDNLEATKWKRQNGSDKVEATTWKRQLVILIGFRT